MTGCLLRGDRHGAWSPRPARQAVWHHGRVSQVVEPVAGPSRRSREELRDLLISAGRDVLVEEGLGTGATGLTFKRVFDRLEATTGIRLTNASVIRRVWLNQAEFQADVLVSLAEAADASGEAGTTLDALLPMTATFDLSSPEGRLRALQDLARVGAEVSMRARMATREWSLWMGVWVLSVTGPEDDERRRVHGALLDGLDEVAELWDQIYGVICASLGLRVRDGLTMRQFTVASAALVEGSALAQGGDPELVMVTRPTGPGGAPEEWTVFGIGLDALSHTFFEIDPAWTPQPPA